MIDFTFYRLLLTLLVICILTIVIWMISNIIIVKEKHTVLTERFGRYSRKLNPGYNFLIFESIKSLCWNIYTQEYHSKQGPEMITIKYEQIPTNDIYIDIPSIECRTIDDYSVNIDLSLTIQITDTYLAVYSSNEIFLQLQDKIVSSCRYILNTIPIANIRNEEITIHNTIQDTIGQQLNDFNIGINCKNLNIQEIKLDEEYIKLIKDKRERDQQIHINEQEMSIKQRLFEQESKYKFLEQEEERRLSEQSLKNQIEFNKLKLCMDEMNRQEKQIMVQQYLDKGFSTDQVTEILLEQLRPPSFQSYYPQMGYNVNGE